ncbi:hypothetical protein [Arthrobacter sp. RCC_34]|uniref:hypothetical protein n=1 Tax=Arthrobacter sp. RCC_34 TaxID=3239230 RepID=UPI0035259B1F
MNSPVYVIRVQLVKDGPGQLLPIVSIAVSVFSVALTLIFRRRDRPRLSAMTNRAIPVGLGRNAEGSARIYVTVTNKSRTATTQVSQLTLELPDGGTFAHTERWRADDVLPADLGLGTSVRISNPVRGPGISLLNEQVPTSWIRARAVCGHRRTAGRNQRKLIETVRAYAMERSR